MSIVVLEGSNGVGKSTIANILSNNEDMILMKSVPDWFQKYISFARSCPLEIQKEIYKIGHEANYYSCLSCNDYIFDRFIYTTIIRINYELNISVNDTVNEILSYVNIPDLVLVLKATYDEIEKRLVNRGHTSINFDFICYENEVFEQLSKKSDIIYLIDNSDDIEFVVDEIRDLIDLKIKKRKR